jgi:hypothetical protein
MVIACLSTKRTSPLRSRFERLRADLSYSRALTTEDVLLLVTVVLTISFALAWLSRHFLEVHALSL